MVRRTFLVTGASSGLGRDIALHYGRTGNNIIATARRKPLLDSLKDEIEAAGGACLVGPADATDTAAAQAVIDQGIAAFGRIDVALLNAGGGASQHILETTASQATMMMRVNFDTMANFLYPLAAHMKAQGGTIAYTGSPAGAFSIPRVGPYGAAKSAGEHLMDSARIELMGTPIKLIALYPGFTYTDSLDPDEVPTPALIITKARAVREMIWAIDRGKEKHMFPKRIRLLIALARWIPEPIRRRILGLFG